MKYMFLDERHVQRTDRIFKVYRHPVKDMAPVLEPQGALEGRRLFIWNSPVWCEERNRWRLWYSGGSELWPLLAESDDGIHWERPCLNRVVWNGSSDNHLVNIGFEAKVPKERRLVSLYDAKDPDPSRRYKALVRVSGRLNALVSPDGLDWTPFPGAAIPSQDEYRLGYDAIRQQFVATVKSMSMVPEMGRTVAISVSEDFVNWTDPELVFWGDETDQKLGRQRIARHLSDPDLRRPMFNDPSLYHTDIYNMPVFSYEDLIFGLPTLFNQSGPYWCYGEDPASREMTSNQDGILYPTLVFSDDLRTWQRGDRSAFIPLSPLSDSSHYDYGMINAVPPVEVGDELWFYYSGTRRTHLSIRLPEQVHQDACPEAGPEDPEGGVFRARLRRDGFVSLSAGGEPGVVLTRPVAVDGTTLRVNVNARCGELRAEIRDAKTGKVIPGYSMGDFLGDRWLLSEDGESRHLRFGTGARCADDPHEDTNLPVQEDGIAVTVRWKDRADVSELTGRQVRICFALRNADLYAFEFV